MSVVHRLGGALAPALVLLPLAALERAGIRACPWAMLTGVPCPGCGMVRACMTLLRGDLAGALRLHPLSPLFAIVVGALLVRHVAVALGVAMPAVPWPRRGTAVLAALLAGVWLVRLAGGLGGLPDPVDLHAGLVVRAFAAVGSLVHPG